MTKTKRFLSLAMVLIIIVSIVSSLSLSVAAVKTKTHYTAQPGSSYTFQVKTTGKWNQGNASIKFHSAAQYQNVGDSAPKMVLTIKDHTTNKTTTKWITGTGDDYYSTLSLAKNRTYTITVSYLNNWSKNRSLEPGVGYDWARGYWEITGSTRVKFQ